MLISKGADKADGKHLTGKGGLWLEWNSAMNEGDVVIERKDNWQCKWTKKINFTL